jgi:hypothetical protein
LLCWNSLKHLLYKVNKTMEWTKEMCKKSALRYKTKTEWIKKSKYSYNTALENNWIAECVEHMDPNFKEDKEQKEINNRVVALILENEIKKQLTRIPK